MVAPTAKPNLIAHSTAPALSTGSTPGRAMSIALAWALGAAPNRVALPEKIFERVANWAWVSSPMTTSHWLRMAYSSSPFRYAGIKSGRKR